MVDPNEMPRHYDAETRLPEAYKRSRHVGDDRHLQTGRTMRSLANNPGLLELHTNAFLSLWREDLTGLTPKETELVIMTTGRTLGSTGGQNEWDSHVQNAMTIGGWTREELEALGKGDFDELGEKHGALARYVTAIQNMAVTDELHDEVAEHYDHETMIGILVLAGYYGLCAVVITALGIEPAEPGEEYGDVG
jgi:alkylhydroperoxidase family enzyme